MTELFIKIINMSLSPVWLIGVVILFRLFFHRAPKWLNPVLWGLVGLRLLLPFSIESAFSLIPSAEVISPQIMYEQTPTIHSGIAVLNNTVNPVIGEAFAPQPGDSANPLQIWLPALAVIWLCGTLIMLFYAAVSYVRLRRQVRTAVLFRDNIYLSEAVSTPFVLGLIRPRILLPQYLADEGCTFSASDIPSYAVDHVIAHEQAHLRRHDHWWKPLAFLLLSIHWFNPAIWLANILFCRDIELACDEQVIRNMDAAHRADYSQALLSLSVPHCRIAACPLAFGEAGVKARVKNVLHYRKPAFWVILAAVAACILTAVCFLTDPSPISPASEAQTSFSDGSAVAWIDYFYSDDMPWGGQAEINFPEFPGVTFRWDPGHVEAVTENEITPLFSGMPVWNVYFTDLTGDGLPELCATVSFGSGLIDERIEVYDYAHGQLYELASRGNYDYVLSLEENQLTVTEYRYGNHEIVTAVGTPEIQNGILVLASRTEMDTLTMSGTYVFDGSDSSDADISSESTLTLKQDGTFYLSFSPLSSYLGHGLYTINQNHLTLHTEDGKYTYVFDMVGGSLVFDAVASSEETFLSGMYDGAVFAPE